jgi:hypothetical protein
MFVIYQNVCVTNHHGDVPVVVIIIPFFLLDLGLFRQCDIFVFFLSHSAKTVHTCIPNDLMFTTKFNDSLILITIVLWNYTNVSLVNEYVTEVTIPTQVIHLYYPVYCYYVYDTFYYSYT